jgi:hypothetical protein
MPLNSLGSNIIPSDFISGKLNGRDIFIIVRGNNLQKPLVIYWADILAALPSGVTFQTDGVDNTVQNLLNLIAGTNITLTPDGSGGVTIDATGGGGTYTVDNGLTENPAGNFQLGGTLVQNTALTLSSYTLSFEATDSRIKLIPSSIGGYLLLESLSTGTASIPRYGLSIPAYLTNPTAGFSLGIRAWSDTTYPGYGKVGDAHFYAGQNTNGLNFINPSDGLGVTENYIRFYAGTDANPLNTPDIHIQGGGMLGNVGYVGFGTITPTARVDVAGKTRTTTFQMTTSPVAGYVLTSDASGNGTWQAGGGGGSSNSDYNNNFLLMGG